MVVLSHRGYWLKEEEQNMETAFCRSFSLGFGTETDIRDYKGNLVISHDIANGKSILVERFFQIYNEYDKTLLLALNIKADGLQRKLKTLLEEYNIQNYFVFDMSVPDGLQYVKNDFKVFTRQSEYEKEPPFYNASSGVWLDEFNRHWICESLIIEHLANDKKVCIVSPDLHKRSYNIEWHNYKRIDNIVNEDIMICTDSLEDARKFFN